MARTLKGIVCYGRQSGINGRVKDFRVEVSADRQTWTVAAEGQLADTAEGQQVHFGTPIANVRYLRFTGLSEQRGQEFASMAEITLIE